MSVWSSRKESCACSAVPAELGEVPSWRVLHFSLAEGRREIFLPMWVPASALGVNLWCWRQTSFKIPSPGEVSTPTLIPLISPPAHLTTLVLCSFVFQKWIQSWFARSSLRSLSLFVWNSHSPSGDRSFPAPRAASSTTLQHCRPKGWLEFLLPIIPLFPDLWLLHHLFMQRSFWTDWRHSRVWHED